MFLSVYCIKVVCITTLICLRGDADCFFFLIISAADQLFFYMYAIVILYYCCFFCHILVSLDYKTLILLLVKKGDLDFHLGGWVVDVEFCFVCNAIRVSICVGVMWMFKHFIFLVVEVHQLQYTSRSLLQQCNHKIL